MIAVPADTPVTTPVDEFTDAIDGLLDDHDTEDATVESRNEMLEPTQTVVGPDITPYGYDILTFSVLVA